MTVLQIIYVTFTKIYNEQVKLHRRTREAVLETIRICKDQNILREYLSSREKEVVDIMMTLFNEEYILKTYNVALELLPYTMAIHQRTDTRIL